jgi:hypothetical protein
MTGSMSLPRAVTPVAGNKSNVVLAANVMVFAPPAWLAALMSAIRSETAAAV